MKNLITLCFLITPFITWSQHDAIIEYTSKNHEDASKRVVYGSVIRSAVNIVSKDTKDVATFKNIESFAYITIKNDSLQFKKFFTELSKISKAGGLTEFLSIKSGNNAMLPGILKGISTGANEVIIYTKEDEKETTELTVIIWQEDKIQIITMKGKIELAKIFQIELKEDLDNKDTLDLLNIF